jgi:3-hexulose-6-phosphate synthase
MMTGGNWNMKLQAALDTLTLEECIALLEETEGSVDIAEVGTPFIIEAGMVPVQTLKEKFPKVEVLADAKIMDAGEFEADKCFEAGADIVTVLGVSHDETIEGVVRSAKKHGGKVMVDMIAVPDLAKRTAEIDNMGVDYICVHTAFDVQASGQDPLEELKVVNGVIRHAKSAVAGGVKLNTMDPIVAEGAEIIVAGGAICNAQDRAAMAKAMKEKMA